MLDWRGALRLRVDGYAPAVDHQITLSLNPAIWRSRSV